MMTQDEWNKIANEHEDLYGEVCDFAAKLLLEGKCPLGITAAIIAWAEDAKNVP